MAEQELLAALGRSETGVKIYVKTSLNGEESASVAVSEPEDIRAVRSTLFKAAFAVAKRVIRHPKTTPEVRKALEAYDQGVRARWL